MDESLDIKRDSLLAVLGEISIIGTMIETMPISA